ncbi:hypothetical protein ACL2XQ_25465 [Sodalis sp. RH14]|uniref:hypothetical protein n=1 Tax=Sodalis sp. RH14 TaxID=3394329 RepID=UPI0039B47798
MKWFLYVLLMIILFITGAIIFFRTYEIQIGSVADWVSSIANLIMAGSALYAAINAQKWITAKANNRGFEYAEDILNDIDELFNNCDKCLQSSLIIYLRLNDLLFNQSTEKEKLGIFNEEFRLTLFSVRNGIFSLKNKITRIERWNIKIIDVTIINDIMASLTDFSEKCEFTSEYVAKFLANEVLDEDFKVVFNSTRESHNRLKKSYELISKNKFESIFN